MKRQVVHLRWLQGTGMCGYVAKKATDDAKQVTCKICLKAIKEVENG